MNISLVVITDGKKLADLRRTIDSVKADVQEVIVVYQGKDENVFAEIGKMATFAKMTTPKGNADPDRNYAYVLANSDWILALDDDEWVPPETMSAIGRLIYTEADVIWFRFANLIDGINIIDILGDDPHPRMWRRREGLINWPSQAHTFPAIQSELQYFCHAPIIHDRRYEDVLARHEERVKVIGDQQAQVEKNFIDAVKKKLGKQ